MHRPLDARPGVADRRLWPAVLVWLAGAAALMVLDPWLDLANEAVLLVLISAIAALWMRPWLSLPVCALAVLAFNIALVPPRGTAAVDLHQHLLLLATMLAVSWIVALLVDRQRRLAEQARRHAAQAEQLRRFGDALRALEAPGAHAELLAQALSGLGGTACVLLAPVAEAAPVPAGPLDADERAGLQLCASLNQAFGPGTGRHEEQPAWYLPLRGQHANFGAALLRLPDGSDREVPVREHAQALCDQAGVALERADALHTASAAQEAARSQALRNTLLAAVSHDYRTPLATILGAASSLHDQADRLTPEQQRRLAATIVDEATQLSRLTDNTLQLARLDTPGLKLQTDWESCEEIVGTVLRRARQRDPAHRVKARLDAGLPLLRCDAALLVQLLDNLVDNALKYGDEAAVVEIVARRIADEIVVAVRDRGPGVPPAWRERIFDTFQRGEPASGGGDDRPARRGAGVGLAVCRAIARAHGGELRYRARSHGGSAFELVLPVSAQPLPDEPGSMEPAA